jgi:hypothetical protein
MGLIPTGSSTIEIRPLISISDKPFIYALRRQIRINRTAAVSLSTSVGEMSNSFYLLIKGQSAWALLFSLIESLGSRLFIPFLLKKRKKRG